MQKKPLYVHILLDRSGSMETNKDITIDAFNEYVNGMRVSQEVDARMSLTLFDSDGIDLLYDALPVNEFPELTRKTFVPRASTPLLDAIGRTVAVIDAANLRAEEGVAFAILTDGQENASNEFTFAQIREILKQRQDKNDWLITYLGAKIDAVFEAAKLGLRREQALSYDEDAGSQRAMASSMGRVQRAYTTRAKFIDTPMPGFLEEERVAAKADLRNKQKKPN